MTHLLALQKRPLEDPEAVVRAGQEKDDRVQSW